MIIAKYREIKKLVCKQNYVKIVHSAYLLKMLTKVIAARKLIFEQFILDIYHKRFMLGVITVNISV